MVFEQKLAQALGIKGLRTGVCEILDDEGHVIDKFNIKYIWIATIKYIFGPVMIAVVCTDKGYQLGLIPPMLPSEALKAVATGDQRSLELIKVETWEDRILPHLRQMTLFVDDTTRIWGDLSNYIELKVYTTKIYSLFRASDVAANTELKAFWTDIVNTVQHVASLYDSEEMKSFAKRVEDVKEELL